MLVATLRGRASHVFAAAHPGQRGPAPDRWQAGGEQPLDEHRRDGLVLGDTGPDPSL